MDAGVRRASTSRTQSSTSGTRRRCRARARRSPGPGRTSRTTPSDAPPSSTTSSPTSSEDVVLSAARRQEAPAADGELSSALDGAVELDRVAPAADPPRDDDAAGSPSTSSSRRRPRSAWILARLLDDECAVEPVRPPDPSDRDEPSRRRSVGDLEHVALVARAPPARTTLRSARAIRPCLPITLPTSSGATWRRSTTRRRAPRSLHADRVRLVDEPSREPVESSATRQLGDAGGLDEPRRRARWAVRPWRASP